MRIKYNYYNIRLLELYDLFSLIKSNYLIYVSVYIWAYGINEYIKIMGGNNM